MSAPRWTSWAPVPGLPPLGPEALAETLLGGQAFRWRAVAGNPGVFRGSWSGCLAELRVGPDPAPGVVEWRAPDGIAATVAEALPRYLAVGTDFAAVADRLPWRSDPVIEAALRRWEGLRLLRQPFGETLLGFLCSATKRIDQIGACLDLLAARHGEEIPGAAGHRSLPGWDAIARLGEPPLRACGLGFRARYIAATAARIADDPGLSARIESMPYAEARKALEALPGVGGKIADCVLLFGAGRLEAFPVDTWILQVLAARYGLEGWKPEALATFGRLHFGPGAGYAQQVLFADARR